MTQNRSLSSWTSTKRQKNSYPLCRNESSAEIFRVNQAQHGIAEQVRILRIMETELSSGARFEQIRMLELRCLGNHSRRNVIGATRRARRAGKYAAASAIIK